MGKLLGRNKSCMCGSGKKYKKCCLNRVDVGFKSMDTFEHEHRSLVKSSRISVCHHPEKQNCSTKIIGAHSIQNNKILNKLVVEGHVIMPFDKFQITPITMRRVGRNHASVFNGFCKYHDSKTFETIENLDFVSSPEQIFLFSYRCLCFELHQKLEVINRQNNLFKKKPSLIQKQKMDKFFNLKLAIKDLNNSKKYFDEALINSKYECLTSIVWELNEQINFAATGFESPSHDLLFNKIQNLNDENLLAASYFLTVFPENNKSIVIISWLKIHDNHFTKFKEQLVNLNSKERKNFLNFTIPLICENIVINPNNWDNWPNDYKEQFKWLLALDEGILEILNVQIDRLLPPPFDIFAL